ncbi:MAG: RimK family alpha-L-glutamate ligase [Candidatus Kapaibacterium sp.]
MSARPEILVIHPIENDPQSVILYEEILSRGGRPRMLPFLMKDGAGPAAISASKDHIAFGDDLSSVRAVFVRGLSVDVPLFAPPYISEAEYAAWRARYIRENQRIYIINQLLAMLESRGALIVNPISTYLHHNTKAQLAELFRRRSLPLPPTFATNDSARLDRAINSQKKYVMKSAAGVGATRITDERHLGKSRELRMSPALFQRRVEGDTVRVHTVGDKAVLSLRIFATDVDSRSDTAGFEVIRLTDAQERAIIEANRAIGIRFSAWDVIIDRRGRVQLLDCNIGPYIYWIGPYFTRLFKAEVARYLIRYSETGSTAEADAAVRRAEPMIDRIYKISDEAMPHIRNLTELWKKSLRVRF